MPPLADRFSEYQRLAQVNQTEEDLSHVTLSELSQERVGFGDAKKGQTFEEAFKDTRWTQFILRRYEKYGTPSHLRFVKFAELKLAAEIPKNKKDTKPKSSNEEVKKETLVEPTDEWDELEEASSPLLLMEEIQDMRQANQNLHNRMGHLESMVEEMVKHLRQMSVKSES